MHELSNVRVVDAQALPSPAEALAEVPLSAAASETVARSRSEIEDVIHGRDPRLLVIVGPCSVHDPDAAIEYGKRLVALRDEVQDRLLVVMRVYFEKPRTTVGWKGLINDPHLDGTEDIAFGVRRARSLLCQVAELGLPAATEMLDPIIPAYIADAVSWAAIGARTTESQTHREMASGLSMPVGFKNGTDGSLDVAINAMIAASKPHSFLGIGDDGRVGVVRTRGNPHGHLVLRGGLTGPNYDAASVARAQAALARVGAPARVMVDLSHDNSRKKFENQPAVLADVCQQLAAGPPGILGVMIESNLVAGRQDLVPGRPLTYGQSITDGCVDFPTTERMLRDLADAARVLAAE